MPADVNLGIDIDKKGSGDKEAAAGLELVAKAADDAADELKQLDRKLLETRAAMLAAGKDFAKTGDASPFKSLLKDERQLNQVRKTLERLTKDVEHDLGVAGDQSSRSFLNRLEHGLQAGLGPISGGFGSSLWTAVAAGAVVAGPAIGAAISSAVLLGVGSATIAGGIIVAAKDPRIRAAYGDLGKEIGADLSKASAVFLPSLLSASQVFREAWSGDIGPQIAKDFEVVTPAIDHLAAGVAGFAHNIMPGFNASVAASVPLLKQLGDDTLPRMGSAIGQFFQSIAQAGPGAQAFFRDLTTAVDLSVKQLGNVTLAMSKLYELYRQPPSDSWLSASGLTGAGNALFALFEKLDGGAKKAKTSIDPLDEALRKLPQSAAQAGLGVTLAAQDFQTLQSAITKTATTTDMLAGQMATKVLNATLSLDQVTLGFAQAQTQLSEAIKENGRQLDIHTAKGQSNRAAVLSVVQANISEYDAMIRSGASAESAAAAYNTNTGALERQMRQAGLTQGQIDGLIGKYRNVPSNVDTEIATLGLTAAINGLADLIRQINNIPTYKTITVNTNYTRSGEFNQQVPAAVRAQRFGGIVAAQHGLITSSPTVLFGERGTGQEAYIPKLGISEQRASMLLGTAAGWWGKRVVPAGGGGGHTFNITVNAGMGADGNDIAQTINKVIRQTVANSGGGNVQSAYGRRGH